VGESRRYPMRGRVTVAATAGVLVTMLAACTAIPQSGGVHAGGPDNHNETPAQVGIPAQQPIAGEDPKQIVSGFRLASSYFEDTSIANAYLSDPTWQPPGVVRVIDDSAEKVTPTVSGDSAKVRVVDGWIGTISADGTYQPQPAGQTVDVTYELTKDTKSKGQWRIVAPPAFLIMSVDQVAQSYHDGNLYFLSPNKQLLVPVHVFVPTAKDVATELMAQLVEGPPAWYAKAAVTTAIPSGTTVLSVTQDKPTGVVTVNLSPDVAGLNPAERDALSAQVVYTLQGYGSGQFKIEVGGQPLPNSHQSAVQTTKTWSTFDPDAIHIDSFYYIGLDGTTRDRSGFPVRGDTGDGLVHLQFATVAPRLDSSTSTGDLIAGVAQDGPIQALYVGPFLHPKQVATGATFSTPSWDALGDVWTVSQQSGKSAEQVVVSGVTPSGATKFIPVATTLPPEDLIETLRVSRDGTRVAVIVKAASSQPQLLVGRVVKTDSGESLDGFYPVAPDLTPVADGVAWASSSQLEVLATKAGAAAPSVLSVGVDGWQQTIVPESRPDATAIAVAPNQALVAATKDDEIVVFRNGSWDVIGPGSAPTYPG
jgi:hypothetical protein